MFKLKPIGYIRSHLVDREHAPWQGTDGSSEAWLEFRPEFQDGLRDLQSGDEILVLTWLDRGNRETLTVHPRADGNSPLRGVFSTRSPNRPNPLGLHRVTIADICGRTKYRVLNLEALDGTPIIDVKPVLDQAPER